MPPAAFWSDALRTTHVGRSAVAKTFAQRTRREAAPLSARIANCIANEIIFVEFTTARVYRVFLHVWKEYAQLMLDTLIYDTVTIARLYIFANCNTRAINQRCDASCNAAVGNVKNIELPSFLDDARDTRYL